MSGCASEACLMASSSVKFSGTCNMSPLARAISFSPTASTPCSLALAKASCLDIPIGTCNMSPLAKGISYISPLGPSCSGGGAPPSTLDTYSCVSLGVADSQLSPAFRIALLRLPSP